MEWNSDLRRTGGPHIIGHASAFLPHQQHIIGREGKVGKPSFRFARQEDDPPLRSPPEVHPIRVAGEFDQINIIHARALQPLIRKGEAAWLDQVNPHAKTR
ncbi:MAG: hypothetical protein RLZZ366_321 [Pseudomonadota bacterium]|jgi:hypothetical protein